jgi:preprotein translocase subunit SecA
MRMFNADKVAHIMEWLKTPPDVPIESKTVSRSIRSAQTQVEQQNFEIRKDLLKYDDVMNRQRHVVYDERRQVLEGADLKDQIRSMIDEVTAGYVAAATAEGFPEEWDLDQLWRAFRQLYPGGMTLEEMLEEAGGDRAHMTADLITEVVTQDALTAYERREEELTPEVMRELERRVVLSVLDRKWREHLYEMDYLREGITLRGYGQRDPLVEYQREGYDMFSAMMEGIKEESVGSLFNLSVETQESPIVEEAAGGALPGAAPGGTLLSGPAPAGPVPGAPVPGGRVPGGGASGGGVPGGSVPGGSVPGGGRGSGRASSRPAPAGGQEERGRPGSSGSPARSGRQGRPGSHARQGGAHARSDSRAAPDGPATPAGLSGRGLDRPQRPGRLEYSAPSDDASGQAEQRTASGAGPDYSKVGRNAPCPCGSGRKFKQCHGDPRNR